MKKNLLLIFALCCCVSLKAQQETQVVLVSAQGKLKYTSPSSKKPLHVRAGAVLKSTGKLTLAKDAKVILYCDGRFVPLKGKSDNELMKACASGGGGQSLGFEYDFGNYVMAGVELAAFANAQGFNWIKSVTDPKVGGDGWGNSVTDPKGGSSGSSGWGNSVTDPKGGSSGSSGWGNSVTDPKGGSSGSSGWGNSVTDPKGGSSGSSGWGNANSKITLIFPFGKVIATNTTFFWSNPGAHNTFHFEIMDEMKATIYGLDLKDTFLQINLNTLKLKPGAKYRWKVSVPNNMASGSNELQVEIGAEEKRTAAMKKAGAMSILKSSDDIALRRLAEAVALERDEWYYSAYETYMALRQTNPNNLTRMMHAAFLRRYGLTPMVEKAAMK